MVTPGTVIEPLLLDSKANNYLTCLVMNGDLAGIAYVDITTSEFGTTQLPLRRVRDELERLKPPELIVPQDADLASLQINVPVTRLDNYHFETEVARQVLLEHFGTATLDGYGCSGLPLAISRGRRTDSLRPGNAERHRRAIEPDEHIFHRIFHGHRPADAEQPGAFPQQRRDFQRFTGFGHRFDQNRAGQPSD